MKTLFCQENRTSLLPLRQRKTVRSLGLKPRKGAIHSRLFFLMFFVLTFFVKCSTDKRPNEAALDGQHIVDKILAKIAEKEGSFNGNGGNLLYLYNDKYDKAHYDKTERIKAEIDRTLNVVAPDLKDKISDGKTYTLHSYSWETPHAKIDMRVFNKLGNQDSLFTYLWVKRK